MRGYAYSAAVSGTWSAKNLGSGSVYLQVTDSGNTFVLPAIRLAPGDNSFNYSLPAIAGLASGERSGTLTVRACKDVSCGNLYPSASSSVSYRLAISPVPDWETLQGNAAHNGYVPIELDAGKFGKTWEWEAPILDGKINYGMSLATGGGGVYATFMNFRISGDNDVWYSVAALDEGTGGLRWTKKIEKERPSTFVTGLAYKAGRLYFGVRDGSYGLGALDAGNGASLFTSPAFADARNTAQPTPYGGAVFAQVANGDYPISKVAAADASTGSSLWNYIPESLLTEPTTVAPAVDASRVYYHDACCIRVLDRQTGNLLGNIATPHPDYPAGQTNSSALLLGSRGNVLTRFKATFTNYVLASYNINTQAREWVAALDYLPYPAVANGAVYALRNDGGLPAELHVLDEATGVMLWKWSPPAGEPREFAFGNIVVTGSVVFFSTGTNGISSSTQSARLWAIDVNTHQMVWSYPAGGDIAISSSGMLYLAQKLPETVPSKLIAFRLY